MIRSKAPLSSFVEYDPGDALGFPARMRLEDAVACWKHDMAYLQTLLDTTGVFRSRQVADNPCNGRQVPNWEICQLADLWFRGGRTAPNLANLTGI